MIKILFDHQIFSEQKYGGISRYFANLSNELNKTKLAKVKIAVLYTHNYYISKLKQPLNNIFGKWLLKKESKRYYWNKKYSKTLLKKANHDIFHATYYDSYSLKYNTKPLVVTIHDMIHEIHPEMFTNSEEIITQKKLMMESASAIIAISNHTKSEIIKIYPKFENKITVVYHGLPTDEKLSYLSTPSVNDEFILFVGERGNYKNFKILAESIAPLLIENNKLKLIAIGGGVFSSQEIGNLNKLLILNQCQQISATDSELKNFYQKAKLFVYPSAQEGFGLPMLEAFKNSCPIACSDSSCLPEIGGDAVQYFNCNDKASIRLSIEKILNNENYRLQLKTKGLERLKHFTMKRCVDETLKVYQSIIKN
jgi:glycosyltransferase involved in cell wall biosynthesis